MPRVGYLPLSLLLSAAACGGKAHSSTPPSSTDSPAQNETAQSDTARNEIAAGVSPRAVDGGTANPLGHGIAHEPKGEPGVLVVGRTVPGAQGPRFAWPGTHFKANFYGTEISVNLLDDDNENEFEVIIDGQRVNKLVTVAGKKNYLLAENLPLGTHQVVLWRRTETSYELTEFISFSDFGPGGKLLPPPELSARRIEVIGDSTTVGYGIEGFGDCQATQSNQNNYAAYSSVAARLLGADLLTVAWSGVGVYRNYDEEGPSADSMPALYEYAIATDPGELWDFSLFDPHVVVVGLGSNDFSTRGDPGPVFIEAYVDFLRRIRSNYPDAEIICLIQRGSVASSVYAIVDAVHSEGDMRVHAFDIRVDRGGRGCEGHANVERNQYLGEKLALELKRLMNW